MNFMRIVDELHESWINGNRSYVIQELFQMEKETGLVVCMYLYHNLTDFERGMFSRMLETRALESRA